MVWGWGRECNGLGKGEFNGLGECNGLGGGE